MSATDEILPPSPLFLAPDEAEAEQELRRFAASRPGVKILTPSSSQEPWRAEVDRGANPDDGREAIFTARQPSKLLRKLKGEFPDGPSG